MQPVVSIYWRRPPCTPVPFDGAWDFSSIGKRARRWGDLGEMARQLDRMELFGGRPRLPAGNATLAARGGEEAIRRLGRRTAAWALLTQIRSSLRLHCLWHSVRATGMLPVISVSLTLMLPALVAPPNCLGWSAACVPSLVHRVHFLV